MKTQKATVLIPMFIMLVFACKQQPKQESVVETTEAKPYVVIIYLDDFGYGDVGA